jgi:hypothetical protein
MYLLSIIAAPIAFYTQAQIASHFFNSAREEIDGTFNGEII